MEQEMFVQTEITFTLRKNGGYRTSGLDSRPFPMVRLAGWLAGRQAGLPTKISFKKILKLCNSPFNLYFECLNGFLNQARAWFLEIAFVHEVGMFACVCVRPQGYKLHSRDI